MSVSHQLHPRTERADELSAKVCSMEQQLRDKEEKTTKVLTEAERSCSALEARCNKLENEIATSRDTIAMREWAIEQLMSGNELYCTKIEELKSNTHSMYSMEAAIASATAEITRLGVVLESERQTRVDELGQLQAELADERRQHAEARDEIETISSSLDQIKNESNDIITQWIGRFPRLYRVVRWYDRAEYVS